MHPLTRLLSPVFRPERPLRSRIGTACAVALLATGSAQAQDEDGLSLYLGGITDPYLGLSEQYGNLAFNSAAIRYRQQFGQLTFDVTAAELQHGRDSTIPRYELSYSFAGDTWEVGVAKRLRNWGPSRYSSLFLSRNAPAMHSAYIAKTEATAFDVPVLEWLGPWDGEFFVGTTDDAGQPSDALFMGMRFAFQPVTGLEIELVRTAQWGGDGFSNSLGTFWDVLIGNTNEGPAANANQLAGLGLSYSFPIYDNTLRLYGQIAGEDESGNLPSCRFYMAGVELETRLFGAPTNVTVETVDTRTNESAAGFCGPNEAYNNSVYSYANKGVVMGAAVDTQGQSTNLYVSHEFADFTLNWSAGHYLVNDTSDPNHRLSSTRTSGMLATVGISKQFDRIRVDGIIAHQGFELDRAEMKEGLRAGVGLTVSF
ncbi:capsule assembly Wzi family protein [Ruegeria sp. HKCCD8929]|uniref:capsule assembly Wzi family protein n=1 Tax=Ruegeria sp. HKCCD8929 TaxID=2683006 RepID=UPI001487BC91|nr:capsule assembly Wzi family protein [Ruegeria sp. HKCCD8929]